MIKIAYSEGVKSTIFRIVKDVILIVEDETNIRANVAEFLRAEDFDTLVAKDGEEAVTIFDEKKPDLVILDLMLPKMDGLEVCKYIRRDSDIPCSHHNNRHI